MKALTVCQPYASLIARGDKPIENRTWATTYRGPLLIHAGLSRVYLDELDNYGLTSMPFGAIVAVVDVVACKEKRSAVVCSWDREKWGPFAHLIDHEHARGPWCWVLDHVRPLATPVPCRGRQGLWTPEAALMAAVKAQGIAA